MDPSVDTVGDSRDNALAESVIGLFRTEVIRQPGRWKTLPNVARDTMHRVEGCKTERLHSAIGYLPPTEAELRQPDPPETIGLLARTVEENPLRQTRGISARHRAAAQRRADRR